MDRSFEPKFLSLLREGYSLKQFKDDAFAGIIVGIVALPLSIAFAIASGVKPEQGLITAVVAGFLISAFSGSRVQIGGPTGAFIVIILGIVHQYGYEGLAVATLMAGAMLILLGILRMGDVIKFIPYPVTVGFTSGIALIIFTTQIRDLLGLHLTYIPEHFFQKWIVFAQNIPTMDWQATFIGLLTIVVVVYWRKVTDILPGPLIAILLTTAIAHLLHWPVETIGSRFGEVPNHFPAPHFPHITLDILIKMSHPAMTIALLAGIESLLSAVVADGMTGGRHRSNMELIAQGIANLISPLFNGIPATGAIARTATNIKNGGRSPIAGIVHAVTILLIFIFFGKWAALIPMATLGGILIVVAYNMSEWHLFVKLFKGPKSDVLVLLCTFLLTVLVDLTVAIEVGVILACFMFMRRMIEVTTVNSLTNDKNILDPEGVQRDDIPEGIEIFEINGPFFFGAADKFKDTLMQLKTPPKVLILRLRFVPAIDATGISALEELLRKAKKSNMKILFSGVHSQPLHALKDAGIIKLLGEDHFHWDIKECIKFAQTFLPQGTF